MKIEKAIDDFERKMKEMKCLILSNEEITEDECTIVQEEVYKEKNGRTLPKKIKRIVGWKGICKLCSNHCVK